MCLGVVASHKVHGTFARTCYGVDCPSTIESLDVDDYQEQWENGTCQICHKDDKASTSGASLVFACPAEISVPYIE